MNPTVLLVDDDRNLLSGLARVLRNQPYDIMLAENAADAKRVLQAHDIQVVVSDECMPGQKGTEFLSWVAEHFPGIIRIVLTGTPSAETAMRAVNDCRVFRFLTKPCREWDLAMAIHDGLEEQRSLCTQNAFSS